MPLRKTGAFRGIAFCRAGAGRSRPDRLQRHTPATSDEPERQIKPPGGGLAGAAEDPALLLYAGLKREPPDRPPPGVPQGVFHAAGRMELRPRQAHIKYRPAGSLHNARVELNRCAVEELGRRLVYR
jgi:hypothetical protein